MCYCKSIMHAALVAMLLMVLLLPSCSLNRAALPPPSNAGIAPASQADIETLKSGIYEEFVDSIALKKGTSFVSNPSAAPQPETPEQPVPDIIMGFRVQLGAFNDQPSAESLAARVRQEIDNRYPVYVRYYAPMWKVHAGDCRTHPEAERMQSDFQRAGYADAWIVNVGIKP